jgi:quercetin dioxygenase-like cupin family protein
MDRVALITVAASLLIAAPAAAQDPTVVDPDHYRVEFENDQIRVLRITYGPHEKSVMHEHPEAYAVMLKGGKMTMHLPGGESEDIETSAGDGFLTPATMHLPENLTDHGTEVVLVELKESGEDSD